MQWRKHGVYVKQVRNLNKNQQNMLFNILDKLSEGEILKTKDVGVLGMDFDNMGTNDLCRAFCITPQALNKWRDKGCPVNVDRTYNILDVINWKLNNEKKKTEEKDLTLKELSIQKDVELKDVKINKEKDNYILRSEHKAILIKRAKDFRMFLENTIDQNYLSFANISENEIRLFLKHFVMQMLEALTGH